MSNVRYNQIASDFDSIRARRPVAQEIWCKHLADFIPVDSGRAIVDVGAGTGIWAHAFATTFDNLVYAVEPSAGMRGRASSVRRHPKIRYLGGLVDAMPLKDKSADGAWLSTVIHQFPDLDAAARELRRVLRPGAPVMIRSSFPGRQQEIELFHLFPSALRLAQSWPKLGEVISSFERAGFGLADIERVREPTFETYDELLELFPVMRRSDTVLVDLDEDEWAQGVAIVEQARAAGKHPWALGLDLLVMQ